MYKLTEKQKRQCRCYQYHGVNASIHEKVMKSLWDVIEPRIPACICPTAITTIGLVANLVPCIFLMFAAPTATEDVTSMILLACVLGMLTHQNLDNMDGRQARRFGVETSVSDFFDHSVDGIVAGITLINMSIAMKLGIHVGMMVVTVISYMAAFYSFHWQEYVTSVAKFDTLDVMEALDVAMGVVFISAVFGQDVWTGTIQLFGVSVDKRLLVVLIMLMLSIFKFVKTSGNIYSYGKGNNKLKEAMYPGITVLYHMVLFGISFYINTDAYTTLPVLTFAIINITFIRAACEVMVAYYTRSVPGVITVNKIMTFIFFVGVTTKSMDTRMLLFAFMIGVAVDLLIYFYRIVCDMNEALGFKWFQLTIARNNNKTSNNINNNEKATPNGKSH